MSKINKEIEFTERISFVKCLINIMKLDNYLKLSSATISFDKSKGNTAFG